MVNFFQYVQPAGPIFYSNMFCIVLNITVSTNARIEPRTVAVHALTELLKLTTGQYLIHNEWMRILIIHPHLGIFIDTAKKAVLHENTFIPYRYYVIVH